MDYNTIFVGMEFTRKNFYFAAIRLRRTSSPIPIQQLPIINTDSPISLLCGTYSEKMRLSCAVMRPNAWDLHYIIN